MVDFARVVFPSKLLNAVLRGYHHKTDAEGASTEVGTDCGLVPLSLRLGLLEAVCRIICGHFRMTSETWNALFQSCIVPILEESTKNDAGVLLHILDLQTGDGAHTCKVFDVNTM